MDGTGSNYLSYGDITIIEKLLNDWKTTWKGPLTGEKGRVSRDNKSIVKVVLRLVIFTCLICFCG